MRVRVLILTLTIVACSTHSRAAQPVAVPAREAAPSPIFILDGVPIRPGHMELIDPAQIGSIEVLKGPSATEQYGASAERGVVQIVTKPDTLATMQDPPLYILDGSEIPSQLARVLDAKRIGSIEVLKGAAAVAYGSRAGAGVVVIRTKAE